MINRIQQLIFTFLLISLCSGCGFHLRGSGPGTLDVSSVHVQSAGANKLADEVKNQLNSLGITTPPSADAAQYTLTLSNESEDRKVLTVSGETGKVQEYEVIYKALMSVSATDGTEISSNQTVTAKRDLTFDEDAVLSKFEEERTIQKELRRQVANSVLRRFKAVIQ